jgi:hypothetical protein
VLPQRGRRLRPALLLQVQEVVCGTSQAIPAWSTALGFPCTRTCSACCPINAAGACGAALPLHPGASAGGSSKAGSAGRGPRVELWLVCLRSRRRAEATAAAAAAAAVATNEVGRGGRAWTAVGRVAHRNNRCRPRLLRVALRGGSRKLQVPQFSGISALRQRTRRSCKHKRLQEGVAADAFELGARCRAGSRLNAGKRCRHRPVRPVQPFNLLASGFARDLQQEVCEVRHAEHSGGETSRGMQGMLSCKSQVSRQRA